MDCALCEAYASFAGKRRQGRERQKKDDIITHHFINQTGHLRQGRHLGRLPFYVDTMGEDHRRAVRHLQISFSVYRTKFIRYT